MNLTGASAQEFGPTAKRFPLGNLSSGRVQFLLWAVLALCIVRLWLMPLPSSFWVDETATAFVVHHGAGDPTLAVAPQVPASIYYVLPKAAEKLLGFSEVVYRLPSLLVMLVALAVIWQLGAALIHPAAGWMVVFACFAMRGFNYQAADARPYGLGTCVAALSLWFLMRWLDRAHWRDAFLFLVMAALLWRVHLIFWPFYLVVALYTVIRVARHETPVSWYQAGGVFLVLGLSLAPVILNALLIFEHAQQHVITERPTLRNFADSLHLGMIAGFTAGASLLAHWRGWVMRGWKFLPVPFALMLGWWLCQPLCLLIFSWITGNSVFVQRYLFLSLPGAAFLAVAMAAQFLPDDAWKPLSALVGIGVLVFIGNWKHIVPEHQESRWREAAMAINRLPGMRPGTPIICPSPYIEAQPPAWSPAYSPAGFLYSHLQVYPLKGTIYPFPFQLSPEAETNAANLTKEILPASGLFVIYGGDRNVRNWRDWFLLRPELAGWKIRRLGSFGDVDAVSFERPGPGDSQGPAGEAAIR